MCYLQGSIGSGVQALVMMEWLQYALLAIITAYAWCVKDADPLRVGCLRLAGCISQELRRRSHRVQRYRYSVADASNELLLCRLIRVLTVENCRMHDEGDFGDLIFTSH